MLYRRAVTFCLFASCLLTGICCRAQSVDSLFRAFRANMLAEQACHRGRVVWDEETRAAYLSLMATAPVDSLLKYTADTIAAVRIEIFAGLAHQTADTLLLRRILHNHLTDTAIITNNATDVVTTYTVKEEMQLLADARASGTLSFVDYKNALKHFERDAHIVIPGRRHDTITRDALLKVDSLTFSATGMRIISFEVMIRNITYKANNIFDQRIRNVIATLQSGDRIYFDNIMAEGPDHHIRQLGSLALLVVARP